MMKTRKSKAKSIVVLDTDGWPDSCWKYGIRTFLDPATRADGIPMGYEGIVVRDSTEGYESFTNAQTRRRLMPLAHINLKYEKPIIHPQGFMEDYPAFSNCIDWRITAPADEGMGNALQEFRSTLHSWFPTSRVTLDLHDDAPTRPLDVGMTAVANAFHLEGAGLDPVFGQRLYEPPLRLAGVLNDEYRIPIPVR